MDIHRDRPRVRQTQTNIERQTQRETNGQTNRRTDWQNEKERERERERNKPRHREIERQTARQTETEAKYSLLLQMRRHPLEWRVPERYSWDTSRTSCIEASSAVPSSKSRHHSHPVANDNIRSPRQPHHKTTTHNKHTDKRIHNHQSILLTINL